MERGNIPGYYYDPDRQKYFKIVPNHVATPGNQYSKEKVNNARKETERAKAQARRANAVRDQLVRPSNVLTSNLAGGIGLQREISQRMSLSRTTDIKAKAYAMGLELEWAVKWRRKLSTSGLSTFAHDPGTGDFLAGTDSELGGHNTVHVYSSDPERKPKLLEVSGSAVSSISLSPSRVAAITCLGGHELAKVTFMALTEPENTVGRTIDYQMSVGFRFPHETTAWTSAASPFATNESHFAVGLSYGAMLFTDAGGDWAGSQTLRSSSDVFALSWLTPSVVSIGHRNGSVKLWDVRSNGSSMRLQHPACVTGIRTASAESLVVCGFESSLAMYDLRMPLKENIAHSNKRRKKHSEASSVTTPSLRFEHENESVRCPGFDIDVDKALVAAANDDGGIDVYSLITGDKVPWRVNLGEQLHKRFGRWPIVTGLQFCKEDVRSGECLMGATEDGLFRLAW